MNNKWENEQNKLYCKIQQKEYLAGCYVILSFAIFFTTAFVAIYANLPNLHYYSLLISLFIILLATNKIVRKEISNESKKLTEMRGK